MLLNLTLWSFKQTNATIQNGVVTQFFSFAHEKNKEGGGGKKKSRLDNIHHLPATDTVRIRQELGRAPVDWVQLHGDHRHISVPGLDLDANVSLRLGCIV